MKQEIKERWVAALRSGKYEQTTCRLASFSGSELSYCCLGVLCDLAFQEGICRRSVDNFDESVLFDSQSLKLPTSVVTWSGLSSNDPLVKYPENSSLNFTRLSWLNDMKELTFEKIADIIETRDFQSE